MNLEKQITDKLAPFISMEKSQLDDLYFDWMRPRQSLISGVNDTYNHIFIKLHWTQNTDFRKSIQKQIENELR